MKKGIMILVLLSFLFFTGCGAESVEKASKDSNKTEADDSAILLEFQPSKDGNEIFETFEYPLTIQEGWSTGDVSANEESLFYITAEEEPMGNSMLKAKIMEYNMKTKEETVCFQYENENKKGFYLNELEAVSDFLFWVRSEAGRSWIECVDLSSGEVSIIQEEPNDLGSVLLQTDGKFLTWCSASENSVLLRAYDIEKQQSFIVSEDVSLKHPRANVQDGITFFIAERNGENFITIYDLKEKKVLKEIEMNADMIDDVELLNAIADDQYYIYSLYNDGVLDCSIYVYDYIHEKLYLANAADDAYVFSFHFVDGKLFINDRNTNSILIRDMETLTETVLMDEEEHLYISASGVEGKGYVALDDVNPENPKILFISQNIK